VRSVLNYFDMGNNNGKLKKGWGHFGFWMGRIHYYFVSTICFSFCMHATMQLFEAPNRIVWGGTLGLLIRILPLLMRSVLCAFFLVLCV